MDSFWILIFLPILRRPSPGVLASSMVELSKAHRASELDKQMRQGLRIKLSQYPFGNSDLDTQACSVRLAFALQLSGLEAMPSWCLAIEGISGSRNACTTAVAILKAMLH